MNCKQPTAPSSNRATCTQPADHDEYAKCICALQARLHVADNEPAAGLQSLTHLMARVQRAAAHAPKQQDGHLQTLRTHESDVRLICVLHLLCL